MSAELETKTRPQQHETLSIYCFINNLIIKWFELFSAMSELKYNSFRICSQLSQLIVTVHHGGHGASQGGALLRVPVPRLQELHQHHALPHLRQAARHRGDGGGAGAVW